MPNLNISVIFPSNYSNNQKTGIIATASHLDYIFQNSGTSNESGRITIPIPNDKKGKYQISFNNPRLQDLIVDLTSSRTINVYFNNTITYTIRINEKNLSYIYLDDAINMHTGDIWNEMPLFNEIAPYIINSDGYMSQLDLEDLPPREFDLYENIMIKIPKFAYKIYRKNYYLYISITNDKNKALADKEYTYDAFSKYTYGDEGAFYIGAYKGSIDEENKLRSISGQIPAVNKSLDEFKEVALNMGSDYGITTYAQLKALQCLYLIKYGPGNPIGRGICAAPTFVISKKSSEIDPNYFFVTGQNKYTYTNFSTGEIENVIIDAEEDSYTDNKPMDYGTMEDGLHHVKVFGIEDFWGNIFEWIDGIEIDANNSAMISPNFQNENLTETGTYLNPISMGAYSYADEEQFGPTSRVIGTTHAGFLPVEFDQTEETSSENEEEETIEIPHWSEMAIIQRGCNLAFGGMWNMQEGVGPFCFAADVGKQYEYRSVGARLTYMP